ncbi:unnamed protein product [Schistosoma curassoni]|nr:unnamed protein product [Schistosoma curassoni]
MKKIQKNILVQKFVNPLRKQSVHQHLLYLINIFFSEIKNLRYRKYQQTKQKRFASYSSLRNKDKIDNSDSYFIVDTDDEDGENTGVGIQNKDGSLGNLVSMSAITRLVKRPHQTKADRMESIEEGRIGREKYGFKVNRLNAYASTTNREKLKNKTFQMIKHKIRGKAKRSFQQKQIALRDHLKKLMKRSR